MEKVFEVVFPFELRAHKSKKKAKLSEYKADLATTISNHLQVANTPTVQLRSLKTDFYHGTAYYFPPNNGKQVGDADNIAKPLWDSLEGVLYKDDRILQLRTAGVFTANELYFDEEGEIDSSVLQQIQSLLKQDTGTVYISIYKMSFSHLNF
ncbi:MAG: RusA family crossover junction endodeoxyribonuclease [Bacteroidota bacterium]